MVFRFGNLTREFDPTELSFVKAYEEAAAEYAATAAKEKEDAKESERIARLCGALFRFFERIFGEGAREEMFGDVCSAQQALDACHALVRTIESGKRRRRR